MRFWPSRSPRGLVTLSTAASLRIVGGCRVEGLGRRTCQLRPSTAALDRRSGTRRPCCRAVPCRVSDAALSWFILLPRNALGSASSVLTASALPVGEVAEVPAVGAQQRLRLVEDLGLLAVEEGLDRVDQVLLGLDQLVGLVEVAEVPVGGLADDLVEQGDDARELADERIAAGAHESVEFVALGRELVLAEPGQLGRVARHGALVEEVGAELLEGGDLRRVVRLLRRDDRVLLLAGVADEGGCLGAHDRVRIDSERDLAVADQPAQHDLDGAEVPAVGLGLEAVDDLLDCDLLAQAGLRDDPRLHLGAGRAEQGEVPRAEQALVVLDGASDLLLGVDLPAEQAEVRVGPVDELLEPVGDPRDGVLGAGRDLGGVDDQLRLADGLAEALDELLLAVGVEQLLGLEDRLHRGRGTRVGALLGVLLRLEEQAQVGQQPLVAAEEDPQLVLAHALRRDLGVGVVRLGRDEVNGQLALVALDDVVELVAEREVLAVLRVLELVRLEDVGREVLEELAGDLGGVDVDRLDLLLDLLFLVGEVLVDVAVALHVRLRLQQVERLLHLLAQRLEVETEAVVDEHGEVAGRGLEVVDVLHQEQRLQQAVGEDRDVGARVGKVLLGLEDGALCGGLQRRADPGEHLVEGGEVAHLLAHRCAWRPPEPRRAWSARRQSCSCPRTCCGRRDPRSRPGTSGSGSVTNG